MVCSIPHKQETEQLLYRYLQFYKLSLRLLNFITAYLKLMMYTQCVIYQLQYRLL
jgi:hypothetical protein